jgi:23S rRNA G2445 N2-methylase RlmL
MAEWTKKSKITISCAKGIPPYLKQEVLSLGFPILSEDVAAVTTEGSLEDTMRLNLFLRTGQRVLYRLVSFKARTPDELYRNVSKSPWEDYIPGEGYFCITSSVATSTIKDSRFANLRCKDAIVDRIRGKVGRRPDTGPAKDKIVIHLHWKGDLCQVFIDTSGEPLSRRGYRKIPLKSPMQETLAAAAVLATGWRGDGDFINPMCGSGTLAIEAALIGLGRAPGLLRSNFGFMHLRGFDESSFRELRRRSRAVSKEGLKGRIIATDISRQAIEAAKKNAMTAGVQRLIEFGVCDYSETPIPGGGGVVILNPEYGERMGDVQRLGEVYRGIGDFFKRKCQGYRGYIFTGNLDLAKKVGLRTSRRLLFYNGPIECRLLEYDLYEGSHRNRTPNSNHQ